MLLLGWTRKQRQSEHFRSAVDLERGHRVMLEKPVTHQISLLLWELS